MVPHGNFGRAIGSPGGFSGRAFGVRTGGFSGNVVGVRPSFRGTGIRTTGSIGGSAFTRPGGFYRGFGGYRPVAIARPGLGNVYRPGAVFRPGLGGYGVRAPYYGRPYYGGYYGRGWRYPYYGWRYPYYGGYYGWNYPYDDDWGWGAAGLVVGTAIGAAAASTYPVYETPIPSTAGGYCATPVRTCALIDPAPVGTGCSCRTPRGRARGAVVATP